jgi:flagellum-specific ATP synthase
MPAPLGATVEVRCHTGATIRGEVVGFGDVVTLVCLHRRPSGVRHGDPVRLIKTSRSIRIGTSLLGRIVDAHGRAIDGRPAPAADVRRALDCPPPAATRRPRIRHPLATGIRAIDGLLTCGQGQRMGIFSGAGVGKSVLLGMLARHTRADVNVIALIGERGREVNEFVQRELGSTALTRSVVVVATSDEPAVMRVQAAKSAMSIAEFFRDRGNNVLLLMDSLTRLAVAQREIGLAAGEPPTTRGYPPSVFSLFPSLLERAGCSELGSITAFYSVLVEGDDPNEPVADTVRALLDGHTVLSRQLAAQGHYPAIDVLQSVSRVATDVISTEHRRAAAAVKELLSAYRDNEDLISVGAYRRGENRLLDTAVDLRPATGEFLRQAVDESAVFAHTSSRLIDLARQATALRGDQPVTAGEEVR